MRVTEPCFSALGFVQFTIVPAAPERNLEKVRQLVEELSPEPNTLLVLPEVFATGFSVEKSGYFAEQTPWVLEQLQLLAAAHKVFFAGSLAAVLPEQREKRPLPCNALFFVGPAGVFGRINKQHLFAFWQEKRMFQPGRGERVIVTLRGILGGLVCYDLRFPGLARSQAFAGAEIMVVSAQWPTARIDHWQVLLRARAIENQAYMAAANGCGPCGSFFLGGSSMVVSPSGEVLLQADGNEQALAVKIDPGGVEGARERFCSVGENPWLTNDAEKVQSLEDLKGKLKSIRKQGSSVAFTNGCFDILHAGHVSYLERARQTADVLVVGLNSDLSVRNIKGETRPINKEADRARVLAALGCVDWVVLFDDDTPLKLIIELQPNVLVKGADWPEAQIVGAKEVKESGGRVERIVFEYDRSTTAVIEKIQREND